MAATFPRVNKFEYCTEANQNGGIDPLNLKQNNPWTSKYVMLKKRKTHMFEISSCPIVLECKRVEMAPNYHK